MEYFEVNDASTDAMKKYGRPETGLSAGREGILKELRKRLFANM